MVQLDPAGRRLHGVGVPAGGEIAVLADQPAQLLAEGRRDVVARERIGDIGGEKSELRAAVERASLELERVARLRLEQPQDRISHLDLAAGALLLRLEQIKDLRLQDVA